jgi:hypothetical protein
VELDETVDRVEDGAGVAVQPELLLDRRAGRVDVIPEDVVAVEGPQEVVPLLPLPEVGELRRGAPAAPARADLRVEERPDGRDPAIP